MLAVASQECKQVLDCIEKEAGKIKEELKATDPGFCAVCTEKQYHNGRQIQVSKCLTAACTKQALSCLTSLPNGIIAMSQDVDGLVQTSLNLGIMVLGQEKLQLGYAVRSSIDQEKEELCQRMCEIAGKTGAAVQVRSAYPGWAYRKESPLRDRLAAVYERIYGHKPQLQAIHAGLECGLLTAKIPGLDCVSIGPDMADVHTTEESLSIESVGRMWEYLLVVLEER